MGGHKGDSRKFEGAMRTISASCCTWVQAALVETPANEMRVSQSMHLESHADAGVVLNHYRGINGCHPRDDCSSVRRHPLMIIVVMWTLGAADELLQLPHGQPAREHDCLEAPSFTPAGR